MNILRAYLGHLSWTPVHGYDFVLEKENVTRLNKKDHFYLKLVLVEPRQDENLDLMSICFRRLIELCDHRESQRARGRRT